MGDVASDQKDDQYRRRAQRRHTIGNLMLVLCALLFLGALAVYFMLARSS